MKQPFDIIVIGGGMVGASLAALLGDGYRIAVIEAVEPADFDARDDVDLRVSAISRASRMLLDAAGAWQGIAAQRVGPFRRMRVWDAGSPALSANALEFDSADIGVAELGHIVENRLIQWALQQRILSAAHVEWFAPSRVTGIDFGARRAAVALDDGRELRGSLIVGADGAASNTRALAGIDTAGYAYDQRAVVAHIRSTRTHAQTAWQRFLPGGPLALLPLADGRCSIVWSTTPAHADDLLKMDDDAFGAAVAAGSDRVLGDIEVTGSRAAFPLRLVHAMRYVQPRLALIGDAAHAVHPLAGQGVNMGFLDAAALVQVLTEARANGYGVGDLAVLRRYERWRKGENLATMAALDALKRLFASDDPILTALRRTGLGLVNRIEPLKNTLIRRAMGLEGDLPRLATTR